jgi:hypothetical protein
MLREYPMQNKTRIAALYLRSSKYRKENVPVVDEVWKKP